MESPALQKESFASLSGLCKKNNKNKLKMPFEGTAAAIPLGCSLYVYIVTFKTSVSKNSCFKDALFRLFFFN